MIRVTCRCGEKLKVPPQSPERIDCPKCGAKIRLHRPARQEKGQSSDNYIRFRCPCGRRLKVPAVGRPAAGKCLDCGRIVPVPKSGQEGPDSISVSRDRTKDAEARTQDLDAADLARLAEWEAQHAAKAARLKGASPGTTSLLTLPEQRDTGLGSESIAPSMPPASTVKFETGLRICPRCQRPVHLSAALCRHCGTPVPRS
jgi:hypothetical protein